jgi:4-hydroxy-3-polyprenylbenzoate decarboxylase
MGYRDLREFLSRLDAEGEVQHVTREVDWNLEMGAIIRHAYDLKAPAPLFENVKDYPGGTRVVGGSMAMSRKPKAPYARLALAFEMDTESPPVEIMEEYLRRKRNPLKPIRVATGPCKENVQVGGEVDLYKFPAPFLHEGDGGRYIGTWHVIITKDPDSGWVNWGIYRLMIHDRYTLGGIFSPQQHMGIHFYQKSEPRNRPLEFAVALGSEPITPLMGGVRLPAGVNEADIVGAVRREPLEVVKCETVDLEVPATAEIVIEGELVPKERREEGPFGEYTGYMGGMRAPRPVYRVKAVTHRTDPILPVCCEGVPITDSHTVTMITKTVELLDDLRQRGFPIRMVWRPPEASGYVTVISTLVPYPNYPAYLANAVWGTKPGSSARFLIIVEEDVDPTDKDQVLWALATRCHPDRGIFKMPNAPGSALDPFLNPYERKHGLGAQVMFDCTWPKDWPQEAIPIKASFQSLWPKEIQEKVLRHWRDYGYGE